MKKLFKTFLFLLLAASTVINYSCKKEEEQNFYTTYNKVDCYYYGDTYNNGNACFIINIHNSSSDSIGIMIEGFTALPSGIDNLNITGSYSVSSTLEARTCLEGRVDSYGLFGSYTYDLKNKKVALITEGTINISISEGKYMITTNFKGKDYNTGDSISSIHYTFNGKIDFFDNSENHLLREYDYDTAKGYYYGNMNNDTINTACFIVDMYNGVDDMVGLWIQGYTPLPSSFDDFDITGQYSVGFDEKEFTCLQGYTFSDDNNLYGTYIYDFNRQKFILVNGGTLDVTTSDGKYVITTNFTGRELNTGTLLTDLCYKFTGEITFFDNSNSKSSARMMKAPVKSSVSNFVRKPFSPFQKRLLHQAL